jgi:epothilone polyketide synthase D
LQVHHACGLQLHGTGTALGDPIEVGACDAALYPARQTNPIDQTAVHVRNLSAVKASLGHAEPAAGLLGIMAAVGTLSRFQV